ncbi:MAG: hypothetical protein M1812_000981 [Candelaria pacifica]|nr:MAG: hypothetical protein M1812_000981 [Candelaria pacifica]
MAPSDIYRANATKEWKQTRKTQQLAVDNPINLLYSSTNYFVTIFRASIDPANTVWSQVEEMSPLRSLYITPLRWLFLIALCLIRIVGGILQLASDQSHSTSLIIAVAVLNSLGLNPLIEALLAILKRVNEGISEFHGIKPRIFNLFHLPMLLAVGLAAYGGSHSYQNGVFTTQTTSKVGIAIFAIVTIAATAITVLTLTKLKNISSGERRLLFAAAASIPFIAVRLLYSIISVFTSSKTFNSITGNVVVYAIMAVLMEFIVIALFLAAGFMAPVIPRSAVQPGSKPAAGGRRRETGTGYHPVHELSPSRQPLTGSEAPYVPHTEEQQRYDPPHNPEQQSYSHQ